MLVLQEQQSAWVRNFNPLLATGARWPTAKGIYEPLVVFNRTTGELVPWLATDWVWTEPALRLRMALRPGVAWSDGAPFVAEDVVFTFDLLRRFPALDLSAVWGVLDGVTAVDEHTVEFVFKQPYSPGLAIVGNQAIVPRHT